MKKRIETKHLNKPMISGASTRNGMVYHLDSHGRPKGMGVPPGMFPWDTLPGSTGSVPVVLVHGFNYDPWQDNSDNNPHFMGPMGKMSTFGMWRRDLMGDRPSIGLGWYSVPMGWRGLLGAIRHSRWNRYRWAFDLAWEAGGVLGAMLRRLNGPVDVLCHSLGSRVVFAALAQEAALPVRNLLVMNGAELAVDAELIARRNPNVRITNLVVRSDRILKNFGAVFAPKGGLYEYTLGQRPLKNAPPKWTDIDLDDLLTQTWGRQYGWDLRGDNPDSKGDHWFTYRHDGNKGMIQAALAGTLPGRPPRGL